MPRCHPFGYPAIPDHHKPQSRSLRHSHEDALRWPLTALPLRRLSPTPRRPLPVLDLPEEASRVLLGGWPCRAQPGQSELPAVGRFLNSCMYRLMAGGCMHRSGQRSRRNHQRQCLHGCFGRSPAGAGRVKSFVGASMGQYRPHLAISD
jgi:hypothetical protein